MMACLALPLFSCSHSPSKQPPVAHKGRLDLRNWDFEKEGMVKLDGEWEFYWKKLLKPGDFSQRGPLPKPAYIRPQDTWDEHVEGGEPIGNAGFGTYRLVILARSDASLALHLPVIYSAHTIWVDGRILASSGKIGERQDDSLPSWKTQVVPIDQLHGETEIIIQASNYFFRNGGIRGVVLLGTTAKILNQKYLTIVFMSLIFGALIIIGIYHLSLYAFRKKDRASLYFGIFCLLIGVYTLLGPDQLDALPDVNGELIHRLNLMMYVSSMPAFFLFQQALFPRDVSEKLGRVSVAAAAIYLVLILIVPSSKISYLDLWYHPVTILTSVYLVAMLARSTMRKRQGAGLALGGALFSLCHGCYGHSV